MRKSISRIFSRRQKSGDKKKRSSSVDHITPPDRSLLVGTIPGRDQDDIPQRLSKSEKFEMDKETTAVRMESPASNAGGASNTTGQSTNRSRENTPPRIVIPSRLADDEAMDNEVDDSIQMMKAYDAIPVLEETKLPRGGVSVETKAVGRIQFGIPPETIKDSMKLGIPVPQVYIVPVERFCREMGPALGVNLAEFEFPAYFNFFVNKKRCTLVVDSPDAEENICRVFSETLLGPRQFRRSSDPITHEPEDFAPDFPKDAIPDFRKELEHFRIMPGGKELVIETLLDFCRFETRSDGHDNLAVPQPIPDEQDKGGENISDIESLNRAAENAAKAVGERDKDDVEDGESDEEEEEAIPVNAKEIENREKESPWLYSHAKFMGDVAVVWPQNATDEQKRLGTVPRVEIFKMPGGTEYIIHDVDADNFIVGKARISGHVKVSERLSVDGFGGHSIMDDLLPLEKAEDKSESSMSDIAGVHSPPTFHPPSFGVTVLGNSHGFDKSGSVSGYVLWINGRGVMIDPPPYSSATLEREGIRPRTIVGIILTHCHADHDAGAFQKVLTGSPVVVITTPTIYKSFIRKYAALSALSPALLRHSHRFKPAIIGQPLRFQGATFNFTYTLHSIPCIGFRVEWRGRSMIFTGDHLNSPEDFVKLTESGVLSKARAADLHNFPLKDADLLLHEAGVPPLHTPLKVLLGLKPEVKKRLFVVHTSALPADCELKVAPTGTKGTIRLDKMDMAFPNTSSRSLASRTERQSASFTFGEDEYESHWAGQGLYGLSKLPSESRSPPSRMNVMSSFVSYDGYSNKKVDARSSMFSPPNARDTAPLVALRPASSTDAWFILNLLSAVPFISSLSYTSTMELLETARVDAHKKSDVVLHASRRNDTLCVIWEGAAAETPISQDQLGTTEPKVWYAGDWTGPISLQPDRSLSGDSPTSATHHLSAMSMEGVKVITVEFTSLHSILKNGSPLYRKYLERKSYQERAKMDLSNSEQHSNTTEKLLDDALRELNVLELLDRNSALRKLSAVQKRHLESLAEGPVSFQPGERLWRAGCPVDRAFIIVKGSASFVPRRRNAGSATVASIVKEGDSDRSNGIGANMQKDANIAMKELGRQVETDGVSHSSSEDTNANKFSTAVPLEKFFNRDGASDQSNQEFEELKRGLAKRHNLLSSDASVASCEYSLAGTDSQGEQSIDSDGQIDSAVDKGDMPTNRRRSAKRRRSSKARKANKVLGRLYNRRAFTGGLVFSQGHFLGDVSKMVAGTISTDNGFVDENEGPAYGFGDQLEGTEDAFAGMVIPEEGEQQVTHTSTLTAGKDGCVVLVFSKTSLGPFLDEYPGLLLSLLGTQVVV